MTYKQGGTDTFLEYQEVYEYVRAILLARSVADRGIYVLEYYLISIVQQLLSYLLHTGYREYSSY